MSTAPKTAGTSRWAPTAALVRAVLAATVGCLVAVAAGRPDLLVLAAPFAVFAAAGLLFRPAADPHVDVLLRDRSLREGQTTTLRTTVRGDSLEQVTLVLPHEPHLVFKPSGAVSAMTTNPSEAGGQVTLSPRRWGVRGIENGLVAVTSGWCGFRWGPVQQPPRTMTVLPAPTPFDSAAEAPHPIGLIGANRSRRPGGGSEFAGLRHFQAGDRLRRINWRTTLRTGEVHVVSTMAEEDSAVLLLVDALTDLGASDGIDGRVSSLDATVRAAGALAEHHLRVGDRVAMRVVGRDGEVIWPGAGMRHHRRILETLAALRPGVPLDFDVNRLQFRIDAGTVVLVLSPLLSPEMSTAIVTLARRGISVVAVDTLPAGAIPTEGEALDRLAWRMRLLERDLRVTEIARTGTPVVSWRGPGTLDEVMHRLARHARMPRTVAR